MMAPPVFHLVVYDCHMSLCMIIIGDCCVVHFNIGKHALSLNSMSTCQEDKSTSSFHANLFQACCLAAARPKLTGAGHPQLF